MSAVCLLSCSLALIAVNFYTHFEQINDDDHDDDDKKRLQGNARTTRTKNQK